MFWQTNAPIICPRYEELSFQRLLTLLCFGNRNSMQYIPTDWDNSLEVILFSNRVITCHVVHFLQVGDWVQMGLTSVDVYKLSFACWSRPRPNLCKKIGNSKTLNFGERIKTTIFGSTESRREHVRSRGWVYSLSDPGGLMRNIHVLVLGVGRWQAQVFLITFFFVQIYTCIPPKWVF